MQEEAPEERQRRIREEKEEERRAIGVAAEQVSEPIFWKIEDHTLFFSTEISGNSECQDLEVHCGHLMVTVH